MIGAKLSALSALKKPVDKDGKLSSVVITTGSAASSTASQPVTVATAKVSRTASASLPTGGGGNQVLKPNATKPARRESVGGTGLSPVGGVSQSQPPITNTTNNNNNHFTNQYYHRTELLSQL